MEIPTIEVVKGCMLVSVPRRLRKHNAFWAEGVPVVWDPHGMMFAFNS